MKKIISAVLASTCMFCSIASATGERSSRKEKAPKVKTTELKQRPTNYQYASQKAFLLALACALDVDVEIKFIRDKNNVIYDFRILNFNGKKYDFSDFAVKTQLHDLINVMQDLMPNHFQIPTEIATENTLINRIVINNHVISKDTINKVGGNILKMMYKRKIAAIEKNKLDEPVNWTEDIRFQRKVRNTFMKILNIK